MAKTKLSIPISKVEQSQSVQLAKNAEPGQPEGLINFGYSHLFSLPARPSPAAAVAMAATAAAATTMTVLARMLPVTDCAHAVGFFVLYCGSGTVNGNAERNTPTRHPFRVQRREMRKIMHRFLF